MCFKGRGPCRVSGFGDSGAEFRVLLGSGSFKSLRVLGGSGDFVSGMS